MKALYIITLIVCTLNLTAQNIASISGLDVYVDNGVVEAHIDGGKMLSVNLKGEANILNNGGYGYMSFNDNNGFHSPSGSTPKVKINTSEIADFYFEDNNLFRVEMHYVFRKNESGFYTYFVISDNGIPVKSLSEVRFALRVDKDIFDYAWTVEREGAMIHPDALANYVEEVQDATYLLQDGSIYTKYDWSVDRMYDTHHGLMGNGTGVWTIESSREYGNGGPSMQDLTVHGTNTTPILLTTYNTTHYGSSTIILFKEFETWSKLWGPAFTYINSGTNEEIIADAKAKASELEAEWPYQWLEHELYPLERGRLSGKLEMKGEGTVDSALVLLSKKGQSWLPDWDWQKQPYDYFFWAEADEFGNFSIDKIRPGTYELHAYTQKGKLISDLELDSITVIAGENQAGTIKWEAFDKQKTIFQLGTPDHKSAEYKLADLPRLYGRWKNCPLTLTYNMQTDNPRDNWYYCQRVNSAWDINFTIDDTSSMFNPQIKVALSGADASPNLEIVINGVKVSTTKLGTDSGIRRSSLTAGKYTLIRVAFDKNLLIEGENTLSLNCTGSDFEYKGLMYDAVLMEVDTVERAHNATLSLLSTSHGELTPVFEAEKYSYTVELPVGSTDIPTIQATTKDTNAIVVKIVNITAVPGKATVVVTAADRFTELRYEVNFSRLLSNDTTLASLTVSHGTLNPVFSSEVLNYSVELPFGSTDIPTVSATTTYKDADVDINNITEVPDTAVVTVTAEDGMFY